MAGGRTQAALMRVVEGKDRLILSKAMINELLDVLTRKFACDKEALARTAVFLSEISEWVQPRKKLNVLKDNP
ncbi:MAG: putative toxin-antitoxin system toxin component, PIN family, partial [Nitrospiria bacterium]